MPLPVPMGVEFRGVTSLLAVLTARDALRASFAVVPLRGGGATPGASIFFDARTPSTVGLLQNPTEWADTVVGSLVIHERNRNSVGWSDTEHIERSSVSPRGQWSSFSTEEMKEVRHQVSLAVFLGLRAVLLPSLPDTPKVDRETLGRIAETVRMATGGGGSGGGGSMGISVWVRASLRCEAQWRWWVALRRELRIDPPEGSRWVTWNDIAEGRHYTKLAIYGEVEGDDGEILKAWLGENVAACVLPSESAKNERLINKMSEMWAPRLVGAAMTLDGDDASVSPEQRSSAAELRESLDDAWASRLAQSPFTLDDELRSLSSVVMIPLQPLGDDLPNGTYHTFEKDRVKYKVYQDALIGTLREWRRHHTPMTSTGLWVRVVVLGAGRGPLIDATLVASEKAGINAVVFAIEKNPHAASFLRLRWAAEWKHHPSCQVVIVEADGRSGRELTAVAESIGGMKTVTALLQWEVLVSELLGSFSDNELSPECIEGFLSATMSEATSRGIAMPRWRRLLPTRSASFLTLAQSAAIGGAVKKTALTTAVGAGAYETPLVVLALESCGLSAPRAVFSDAHHSHSPASNGDASREVTLRFVSNHLGRVDGLLGTFECVFENEWDESDACAFGMEKGVEWEEGEKGTRGVVRRILSTRAEAHTEGLVSWFPMWFPSAASAVKEAGETTEVTIRRIRRGGVVWYEWAIDGTWHNVNGWAHRMTLES